MVCSPSIDAPPQLAYQNNKKELATGSVVVTSNNDPRIANEVVLLPAPDVSPHINKRWAVHVDDEAPATVV
jgi:hypothetical protein